MNAIGWDSPSIFYQLADLHRRQIRSRVRRSLRRIASPQRIVATSLAVLCLVGYAIAGLTILAQRTPVEPENLQRWLSGSMVIYSLYHLMRSVWTVPLSPNDDVAGDADLSDAARLWLAGAPLQRSSILSFELVGSATQAVFKTALLALILFHDVAHLELLVVGMLGAILLLEIVRRILDRTVSSLSRGTLLFCRASLSLATLVVGASVILNVSQSTPSGSPTGVYLLAAVHSLGNLASTPIVQSLAAPWWAASSMAVAIEYNAATVLELAATTCSVPLAMIVLVMVDRHSTQSRIAQNQQRALTKEASLRNIPVSFARLRESRALRPGEGHPTLPQAGGFRFESKTNIVFGTVPQPADRLTGWFDRWDSRLPPSVRGAMSLAMRQMKTLRQHVAMVLVSLLIPVLLSLSPLLIDRTVEQWLFVIGGVLLSTLLLAPPALRLDFRRDVRRLSLLSGLPIEPRMAVLGQLFVPVALTIAFQGLTLVVAAGIARPGIAQTVLWLGILPPFAVMVFAAENAIFLAFPHQERAEGIAMVVRTKVIFLAKALSLLLLMAMLVGWAVFCRSFLPPAMVAPVYVLSAIAGAGALAEGSIRVTARVWRQFDSASDVPFG